MESNLIGKNNKGKLKLISFVLILALFIGLLPIASFAAGEKDVTSSVDMTKLTITYGGKNYVMPDDEDAISKIVFVENSDVKIRIDWQITDTAKLQAIKAGDFFDIKMPDVFKFALTTNPTVDVNMYVDGSSTPTKIGTYTFYNNTKTMHFVFSNDMTNYKSITNGYLDVTGNVNKNTDNEHDVVIGDFDFHITTINQGSEGIQEAGTGKTLTKSGAGQVGGRMLWSMEVNNNNLYKLLRNQNPQTLTNVVITDDLEEGSIVNGSISLSLPVPLIDINGKVTNRWINGTGTLERNRVSSTQIPKINQALGETYEEFYVRVTDTTKGPQYGIYDGYRVIISLGDLPSSKLIATGWNWATLKTIVTNYVNSLSAYSALEKTAMINKNLEVLSKLYGSSNPADGDYAQAIALYINFEATYYGTKDRINNVAKMTYGGGSSSAESGNVTVQKISGGAAAQTVPKGQIKITKYEDGTTNVISGVAFTLQQKVNGSYVDVKLGNDEVYTLITDNNGEVTFKGLPVGDYRIIETGSAPGYIENKIVFKDKNGNVLKDGSGNPLQYIDFAVKSTDTEGFKYTASNFKKEIPKGEFELTKVDGTDGKGLSGGIFALTKMDSPDFYVTATAVNGKVTFGGLGYGRYILTEVEAPEGYIKDLKYEDGFQGYFDINESNLYITATAKNGRKDGSFEFIKYDQNGGKLSGGAFTLTDKDGKVVATESAVDGKVIFDGLKWGTYTFKEVTAPTGYDGTLRNLIGIGSDFKVTIDGKHLLVTASGVNTKLPSLELAIEKFADVDGANKHLAGAEFQLTKEDGTLIATVTSTSDGSGIVKFPELIPGTYYIKETKSPDGYKLLANPIKIEIVKASLGGLMSGYDLKVDGKNITSTSGDYVTRILQKKTGVIAVENYKGFSLPMTGGMGILAFIAIGLIGILSVSIVIMRRRRKVTA